MHLALIDPPSEVDFECYLSWTHVLLEVIAFLRCLTSMLDFDAICGVPEHLAIIELPSEVDFERYLSWPDALLEVIAFLRCLILMLFVVAGGTLESHCLPSMLDFDAICGVSEHLAILLFAFDA